MSVSIATLGMFSSYSIIGGGAPPQRYYKDEDKLRIMIRNVEFKDKNSTSDLMDSIKVEMVSFGAKEEK